MNSKRFLAKGAAAILWRRHHCSCHAQGGIASQHIPDQLQFFFYSSARDVLYSYRRKHGAGVTGVNFIANKNP